MEKNQKSTDKKEALFKFIIIPFLFLLVIFHLLSGYIFPAKLWGIHHLYFFSLSFGVILTLIALLTFVPKISLFCLSFFERITSHSPRFSSRFNKHQLYILISLFALLVFWFLRTKLYLLGDGYLRINEVSQGIFEAPEWLDGLLHVGLYKFLSPHIEWWTPALTYSILSIFCGGLFVYVILFLSDLLGKTNFEKFFIGALIFSCGSLELFFGYVEAYATFTVSLAGYILFSILYLRGRVSLILVLFTFLLSCALHIFAVVFIPSFLYLLWRDMSQKGRIFLKGKHIIIFSIFSVFMFFEIYFVSSGISEIIKSQLFFPLFPTPKSNFTLFCWDHILEYLNQLLLLSPAGILMFLFFLPNSLKLKEPELNFLLLGSLFSLLFIFLFNSILGPADWDLRSFPAVFYVPLGGILFIRFAKSWKDMKSIGVVLIFVSFFHLISWILIHTNDKSSIEHFELIELNDPHPQDETNYNVFKVAVTLERAGLYDEVEKVYRNDIRENPQNERNYYNLAGFFFRLKRYEEAESLIVKVTTLFPEYYLANEILGAIYHLRGNFNKALFYYLRSMRANFGNTEFIKNLCAVYLELGRLNEFKDFLEAVISAEPQLMEARRNLGYVYFLMKDYQKAKREWEMALKLKPDDSFCILWLNNLKKMLKK